MPTVVHSPADLLGLVGADLGTTDWVEVTQDRIVLFADATGDHQWIHVDVERAEAESPFGGPIAHGYLTLSMVNLFLPELLTVEGASMGVNVGLEKVRFPSPVPVGSNLRLGAQLDAVDEIGGGWSQISMTFTFEVEGASKPACVAEIIFRYQE